MLTKRARIAVLAVPLLAASAGGAYAAPPFSFRQNPTQNSVSRISF